MKTICRLQWPTQAKLFIKARKLRDEALVEAEDASKGRNVGSDIGDTCNVPQEARDLGQLVVVGVAIERRHEDAVLQLPRKGGDLVVDDDQLFQTPIVEHTQVLDGVAGFTDTLVPREHPAQETTFGIQEMGDLAGVLFET